MLTRTNPRRSPKYFSRWAFLATWGLGVCLASTGAWAANPIEATLVNAPNVPPPITRTEPAHVIINLQTEEKVGELSEGVQYEFWTYNGKVPGPFIRLRQGDTFEVRLDNSKGKLTHTVDFHAVTGPGGRANALMADPGKKAVAVFKALNAGFFVYHCAAPPIPAHISNGLYGVILVEPAGGMPKVDREYYVMQSEFYTEGEVGDEGLQTFSSAKGSAETPEYIVFNGHTQSLMGEGALKANVGESVRLYVGNIGPNKISSFHVIGEIFDAVYREGSVSDPDKDVQTTLIPSGSASIVDFKVDVPGNYLLVDHAIFRILRGAVGVLAVAGAEQPDIYAVKQKGSGAASGH